MKILVVCDQGVNRSHTIKSRLQYWGHDILTVGLAHNAPETLVMLMKWADKIILTAKNQYDSIEAMLVDPPFLENCAGKTELWDIGPDVYPRPLNPELLVIVTKLIDDHRNELKP